MSELLLMRHAKASPGRPDFDRPLTSSGKRIARRVGNWLLERDEQLPVVIASPAIRALTTAEECIGAAGGPVEEISTAQQIYEAGIGDLLAVLEAAPQSDSLLMVGHNPGIARLTAYLIGQGSSPSFGTGFVARCEWSGRAESGSARLLEIVDPEQLPAR